jgi:hypothetical protein
MMFLFTSPTLVRSPSVTRTRKYGGIRRHPCSTALTRLLKVLSLLQAGDPTLAHDVAASREALWGILEDPVKFTAVTQGGSQ